LRIRVVGDSAPGPRLWAAVRRTSTSTISRPCADRGGESANVPARTRLGTRSRSERGKGRGTVRRLGTGANTYEPCRGGTSRKAGGRRLRRAVLSQARPAWPNGQRSDCPALVGTVAPPETLIVAAQPELVAVLTAARRRKRCRGSGLAWPDLRGPVIRGGAARPVAQGPKLGFAQIGAGSGRRGAVV